MTQDLSRQAANSAAWSIANVFCESVLRFVTTAILARFLAPADFGILGLASILMGLVAVFGQLGLSSALIYKTDMDERDLRTSFTITFSVAVLLTIVTALMSPLAADFFRDERVQPVAALLSLTFLINGISSTNACLLTKYLQFKKTAMINVSSIVLQCATALILVIQFDWGIYGLVAGMLVADTTACILRLVMTDWFPRFGFDKSRFDFLFKYSRNLYGSAFTAYLNANIDYIVIGRVLDSAALGFYQFAYSIPNMAQTRFTLVVNRVLFPVLCKVQDDLERFRSGYYKTVKWISMITFPTLGGLALIAQDFVLVVYGERWLPIVVPMQILCISGAVRSIFFTNGSVLNARGMPHIVFQWGLMMLPVTFLAVFIGSTYGITGVAWAMSLVLFCTIIPLRYVIGAIEMPARQYLSAFVPATVSTGVMAILIWLAIDQMTEAGLAPVVRLFAAAGLGAAAYSAALWLLFRKDFMELWQFGISAIEKKRKR